MRQGLVVLALVALAPVTAGAGVATKEVEYRQGGAVLQGFMAWDDAAKDKRPGFLVVHEWWGHNQHARNQAKRLAEAGYVGFALDMYGKGKLAAHPQEAQAFMQEATKDASQLRERFMAALDILKKDPRIDPGKIGAIGYCFGGGVVLGMARQGVDLRVVASFHGSLGTDTPAKPGAVKARVLVLTGAADPMAGPDIVEAFKKEMTSAGARFDVISYPGVKHSFTNPEAGTHGMDALAYDAEADKQSWAAALKGFSEAFPRK